MRTLARPGDKAEILARLRTLRPESARRWGRMSAHQMACHLADSFRFAVGRRPARAAPGLAGRTVVKWIALYVPLAWPAGIATSPEVDSEQGGTRPADFGSDLAELGDLVQLVATQPKLLDGRVHPVFGRMSERAWLRWGWLHADHHLRQFGA
ncbi:MAG TPA: DUF1569 domain-containing protein [Vicinamibacteria bacterium]|jgi:hypothetical protein|nr:DUF1569 domain-containing protein [Vicinamibacteria bacterium]